MGAAPRCHHRIAKSFDLGHSLNVVTSALITEGQGREKGGRVLTRFLSVLTFVWICLFFGLFFGGETLLGHLGAGTVPRQLKSLASSWGIDAKWIRLFLWAIFGVIALILFIPLANIIYRVLNELGSR